MAIRGTGFSSVDCENVISVGEYSCTVQTSSATELTCLLDPADSMPVGEPLAVTVIVKNRGRALNRVPSPSAQGFTLRPRIDGLSTHQGSVVGGTQIVVTGSGFQSPQSRRTGNLQSIGKSITRKQESRVHNLLFELYRALDHINKLDLV